MLIVSSFERKIPTAGDIYTFYNPENYHELAINSLRRIVSSTEDTDQKDIIYFLTSEFRKNKISFATDTDPQEKVSVLAVNTRLEMADRLPLIATIEKPASGVAGNRV